MREISGSDLGVANCQFKAESETTEAVIDQMADHLGTEHDIRLPETGAIMDARQGVDVIVGRVDEDDISDEELRSRKAARLIVQRMREMLNIED